MLVKYPKVEAAQFTWLYNEPSASSDEDQSFHAWVHRFVWTSNLSERGTWVFSIPSKFDPIIIWKDTVWKDLNYRCSVACIELDWNRVTSIRQEVISNRPFGSGVHWHSTGGQRTSSLGYWFMLQLTWKCWQVVAFRTAIVHKYFFAKAKLFPQNISHMQDMTDRWTSLTDRQANLTWNY